MLARIKNPRRESTQIIAKTRITGEYICIDGGMTRQMIYHGENGWRLQ
ncbi:MAG: hypothetical protein IKZ54_02990 [Bacteroidales bacterium]|nr:hypothetical protein [Bacteroidales bacterium]